MALDNFTVTTSPFTAEKLTDSNTIYIDSVNGSDSNAGTRALPKKTLAAINTSGKNYLLRGVFSDNFIFNVRDFNVAIIGDLNTYLTGTVSCSDTGSVLGTYKMAFLNISSLYYPSGTSQYSSTITILSCKISSLSTGYYHTVGISKSIVGSMKINANPTVGGVAGNTIDALACDITRAGYCSDLIINKQINLYSGNTSSLPYYFVLDHTIIRKQASWLWKGSAITIDWTSSSVLLDCVKTSLTTYANALTDASEKACLLRLVENMFGTGCLVYDDAPENLQLYNDYDSSNNPVDYTLNRDNGNPALYTSSSSSYVGAYRPNVLFEFDFANVVEIDDDGAATGNAGTLLQENDGIFFNVDSSQTRNKVSSNVIALPLGDRFTMFRSTFFPSFSDSFCFGAKQNLTSRTDAVNAVLVEPYDTATTVSSYPKLFAPINREVSIAYYSASETPVLFNDLAGLGIATNKNLTEVGAMAVTNACDEFDDVIALSTVTQSLPKIRFFKITLLGNRI